MKCPRCRSCRNPSMAQFRIPGNSVIRRQFNPMSSRPKNDCVSRSTSNRLASALLASVRSGSSFEQIVKRVVAWKRQRELPENTVTDMRYLGDSVQLLQDGGLRLVDLLRAARPSTDRRDSLPNRHSWSRGDRECCSSLSLINNLVKKKNLG